MSLGRSTRRRRALILWCRHCVGFALCWCTCSVYTVKKFRVFADAYYNWSPAEGPTVTVLTRRTENTDSRSDHRRSVVWQPVSRADCPQIAESGPVVTGEKDAPLGNPPQGLCERRTAAIQPCTFRCFFPGVKSGLFWSRSAPFAARKASLDS